LNLRTTSVEMLLSSSALHELQQQEMKEKASTVKRIRKLCVLWAYTSAFPKFCGYPSTSTVWMKIPSFVNIGQLC